MSKRNLYIQAFLGGASLALFGLGVVHAEGQVQTTPHAWAQPSAKVVRRVSNIDPSQHQPNFLSNLDCDQYTYRQPATTNMQTGCFTPTAFGLMDTDTGVTIFNGSDEALPLLAYGSHEGIVPWPKALNLLTLDASSTGGSYVAMYKNPLGYLQDQRNVLGQLIGKQITAPPDIKLFDQANRQLLVSPQSLAYSSNGSWLVAQTDYGVFLRINLATLETKVFAPAFIALGDPAEIKSQVAISDDGQFVALESNAAQSFKVYDLSQCGLTSGVLSDIKVCRSYEYWPFLQSSITSLHSLAHLRFVNSGLLSFEAGAANPDASGVYELAPFDKISSLLDYLGLGDSYTSGEGAFNYRSGTDTTHNHCHLSARSYPILLSRDLFGGSGANSVACSGAVINDVQATNINYHGQATDSPSLRELTEQQTNLLANLVSGFAPGYLPQHYFVQDYQPRIITVSVGGNDIGFGNILERCVMPHLSIHHSDNSCFNTYEDRLEVLNLIDRTIPRWTALYRQLKSEDPNATIYVVGYPQIVSDTGKCGLNVHFSKEELEFFEETTDYLNTAIKRAATASKVTYIDIGQALIGHRLCEGTNASMAVNGLTAGKDAGLLGLQIFARESYHPNFLGQQLMEQTILRQTDNFRSARTDKIDSRISPSLLAVPKTGRPTFRLIPGQNNILGTNLSNTLHLSIGGALYGLRTNAGYTVRLDGPSGPVVGKATSDSSGDISTDLHIPPGSTGGHSIDTIGPSQTDEAVDLSEPVELPNSGSTDNDGDGIPNGLDSCPTVPNSGRDDDKDNVDDACDGSISNTDTTPPHVTSSNLNPSTVTAQTKSLAKLGQDASHKNPPLPTLAEQRFSYAPTAKGHAFRASQQSEWQDRVILILTVTACWLIFWVKHKQIEHIIGKLKIRSYNKRI